MATEVDGFTGLEEHLRRVAKRIDAQTARVMLRGAAFAAGGLAATVSRTMGGGALARSFQPTLLEQSRSNIISAALSALPYAGVRDRPRTVITPVRRKWLAIPIADRLAQGASPRDYPSKRLVWYVSKKGNFLVALKHGRGKKARLENLFVLKKEVVQHGIGYIRTSWEENRNEVMSVIADGMQEIIDG